MALCSGLAQKDTTAQQALHCPINTLAPQVPSTQDSMHTAFLTAFHVLLDNTVPLWDYQSQQVRRRLFSFFLYCAPVKLDKSYCGSEEDSVSMSAVLYMLET